MAKSKSYSSFVSNRRQAPVPVTSPLFGRKMVHNNDAGYAFATGNWKQLDRFLILGACSPTYYCTRKSLVLDNTGIIKACIKEDGPRVVRRIVEISKAGRAPKNDPALYALALCMSEGNDATRQEASKALNDVARIGTHLYHFCNYANDLRGWGRNLKKTVSNWFHARSPESLAKQVIKYRSRDGWDFADVLRLSHPVPKDDTQNAIFHWLTKGWENVGPQPHPTKGLDIIWAFEKAKRATTAKEVARLVSDYELPWEAVDTKWLKDGVVLDALMENIQPEALTRQLGRLTACGYLAPLSNASKQAVKILTNEDAIIKSRLHPYKILVAQKVYQRGHGSKGKLTWSPLGNITAALEDAYYKAFKAVEPSGCNVLCALDVSGSMTSAYIVDTEGSQIMTAREASAAMAMVTARTEPNHYFVGFTRSLYDLNITPTMTLDAVTRYLGQFPADYTDGSLPMLWAKQKKIPVDVFVLYTDNEMNNGIHPCKALEQYRQAMGRQSKMVVVAMTSTGFTIADPEDERTLDVVGFDTSAPGLISDFAAGRI